MFWKGNKSRVWTAFGKRFRGAFFGIVTVVFIGPTVGAAPVHLPIEPVDGEVLWRWIGILDKARDSCDPGNLTRWSSRRMFSTAARLRWPPLDPFCVYEFTTDGSDTDEWVTEADLQQIRNLVIVPPGSAEPTTPLISLVPDRAVVTTAGVVADAFWPQLADIFDEQAGWVPLPVASGGPQVRLTVVDTSPTGGGGSVNSPRHGRTLRLMAEHLLCSSGPCVADVRTRLALAYTGIDPDSRDNSDRNGVQGGFVGLVGELAEAITAEVDDWKSVAALDDRLILNLSVAWDRAYGGADLSQAPNDLRPDIRAVYEALADAACDGDILTVVAAGNLADRHASNITQGALLPAAWRPWNALCPGTYQPPLVVAVSAVDRSLKPLVNTINGSVPEIVAYGDHGVIQDPAFPNSPTAILTGSSVSALVTSATLAAVAAYRSDLTVQEVVDVVYSSGVDLLTPADLCAAGSTCPTVRAVSLCGAVQATCASSAGSCPPPSSALPSCIPRLLQLADFPSQTLAGLFVLPQISVGTFVPAGSVCSATCGTADRYQDYGPGPSDPCPDRQYHGVNRHPFTHPQPASAMCPTCTYVYSPSQLQGNQAVAYVDIDTASLAPGETIAAPTLELQCGFGPPQVFHLGGVTPPLSNNAAFVVTGLPTGCSSANFSFVIENSFGNVVASASQPILIAVSN